MTLRCARCHDHKFDPVSREDYYGLYAIFASTVFPYAGSEEFASMNRPREHFVPLDGDAKGSLAAYRKRLADLTAQWADSASVVTFGEGHAGLAAYASKTPAEDEPIRRAFHAKLHVGIANAQFTIRDDVRPELRAGVFASGATHPAIVRFSNSSGMIRSSSPSGSDWKNCASGMSKGCLPARSSSSSCSTRRSSVMVGPPLL